MARLKGRNQVKRILVTVLAMAFTVPAIAGGYVGGSFGSAKASEWCDLPPGVSFVPGVTCDDSDSSFRFFGGYKFSPNFAVEGGYIDLGTVSVTAPTASLSADATAFDVSARGILPVGNNFEVYGRVGIYFASRNARVTAGTLAAGANDTRNDVLYGVGATWNLPNNMGLRAEWIQYTGLATNNFDIAVGVDSKSDVSVMNIGLVYSF